MYSICVLYSICTCQLYENLDLQSSRWSAAALTPLALPIATRSPLVRLRPPAPAPHCALLSPVHSAPLPPPFRSRRRALSACALPLPPPTALCSVQSIRRRCRHHSESECEHSAERLAASSGSPLRRRTRRGARGVRGLRCSRPRERPASRWRVLRRRGLLPDAAHLSVAEAGAEPERDSPGAPERRHRRRREQQHLSYS